MVLQSNGNYHRIDSNSTGIFPTLHVGYCATHVSPDGLNTSGIFHDMCHFFLNIDEAGDWSCSQHYPLIYHSEIYIKIIYVNSFN